VSAVQGVAQERANLLRLFELCQSEPGAAVVDFPRSKPQSEAIRTANEELAKKFAVDSFPTIIVLDPNGKKLSKESGYDGSNAKEFVANLKKLKVK